jgi:hypothetical protein
LKTPLLAKPLVSRGQASRFDISQFSALGVRLSGLKAFSMTEPAHGGGNS